MWSLFPPWADVALLRECERALRQRREPASAECFEEHLRLLPHARLCVQRAGEAVFVPGGWFHSTVNVGDVLGVANVDFTGHE